MKIIERVAISLVLCAIVIIALVALIFIITHSPTWLIGAVGFLILFAYCYKTVIDLEKEDKNNE